jgi:hypothetical protein
MEIGLFMEMKYNFPLGIKALKKKKNFHSKGTQNKDREKVSAILFYVIMLHILQYIQLYAVTHMWTST